MSPSSTKAKLISMMHSAFPVFFLQVEKKRKVESNNEEVQQTAIHAVNVVNGTADSDGNEFSTERNSRCIVVGENGHLHDVARRDEDDAVVVHQNHQNISRKIVVRSYSESLEFCEYMMQNMALAIEKLNLEGKTAEEIEEKVIIVNKDEIPTPTKVETARLHIRILMSLFRHFIPGRKIREKVETLHPSDREKYDLRQYNNGIVALGVENFMSAVTQFLAEERAAAGNEVRIVSIGSGDGTVEKNIISEYRRRYGRNLRIELVDCDPKFEGVVDFRTVDELIENCPHVVGDCVALINWPDPIYPPEIFGDRFQRERLLTDITHSYDIRAVRDLQPRAAFVVYECMGSSGSNTLRVFLNDQSPDQSLPADELGVYNWLSRFLFRKRSFGLLHNYSIAEIDRRNVWLPGSGTFVYKMVKLKRSNAPISWLQKHPQHKFLDRYWEMGFGTLLIHEL